MSLIQLTHKLIFVLPFMVLFLGLGCIQDKSIKPVEHSTKSENDLNDVDSLHFNYQDTLSQTKTCPCEFEEYSLDQTKVLSFSNNGKPFDIDSLKQWINHPDRLNVSSLTLIDFDTIPTEMSIFENVERIYLIGINFQSFQGLDLFPKLKIIHAEQVEFEINTTTNWIKNIEVIIVNKTKFIGLTSFNQVPNLKKLTMSFSGFDVFPADINSLKCLHTIQIGAHTFGTIDLSQVDFTNMPCLKYVEFQSWRKNIIGTPKGTSTIETVKINYPKE